MPDTRYTADHLWVRLQDGVVTAGLTRFAQEVLEAVTLVRLPEPGRRLRAGEAFAVIESAKAASDVCAPVAGRVTEANDAGPVLVNRDPEGAGWLIRMAPDDPAALDALMDRAAYDALVGAL